jgi:hypothetical protein
MGHDAGGSRGLAAIVPGLAGQDGFAGCYADEGRGLDVTFDVHLSVRAHDCQAVGQLVNSLNPSGGRSPTGWMPTTTWPPSDSGRGWPCGSRPASSNRTGSPSSGSSWRQSSRMSRCGAASRPASPPARSRRGLPPRHHGLGPGPRQPGPTQRRPRRRLLHRVRRRDRDAGRRSPRWHLTCSVGHAQRGPNANTERHCGEPSPKAPSGAPGAARRPSDGAPHHRSGEIAPARAASPPACPRSPEPIGPPSSHGPVGGHRRRDCQRTGVPKVTTKLR